MSVLRPASALVLSIVLSVFCATATAVAQSAPSTAPPGNSAVDQYRESAPPSSSTQRRLGRRDRAALERRGTDGAALAAVLERAGGVPQADASGSAGAARGKQAGRGGSRSGAGSDEASGTSGARDGASAVGSRDAAGSRPIAPAAASSTVGPVPVWAMLAAAAALVGIGLIVRARTSS